MQKNNTKQVLETRIKQGLGIYNFQDIFPGDDIQEEA